jgi:hypothetical protein
VGTRAATRQRASCSAHGELGKQSASCRPELDAPVGLFWPRSDLTGLSSPKAWFDLEVGPRTSYPPKDIDSESGILARQDERLKKG